MQDSGLYIGKRHGECDEDGCGIPVVVDETAEVEVEGGEYKICKDAISNPEVLEFTNKTNLEILEEIHKRFACKFEQNEAESGDFILCRLVVNDKVKRTRKGTVQQVLDEMQNEKSCRVSAGGATFSSGGKVGMIKVTCHKCGWKWESSYEIDPEPYLCHKCNFDNRPFYLPNIGDEKMKSGGAIAKVEPTEEELHQRWHKKKQHVQQLANSIRKLRYNVTKDLASKDEKTFLTALVIAIMDRTAERPGNEESESNGRFGVTGFQKKHVSINGNTITFKYVGKSKVKHEKSISDALLAKSLKRAIKNSPSRFVFTSSDGFRVKADKINRYLNDYEVTAKDIRGYSANKWITQKLEALSIVEKDEKKRQKQFNKIAKEVAKKVGHGAATLKKHYLIPELEERFVKRGKIIDLATFYKKGGEVKPSAQAAWKHKEGEPLTQEQFDSLPLVFMLYGIISGEPVWVKIERPKNMSIMQVEWACQNYNIIKPKVSEIVETEAQRIYVYDQLTRLNSLIESFGLRINYGLNYILSPIVSEEDAPILAPIYFFSQEDPSDKYGIHNQPYIRFNYAFTENIAGKTVVYSGKKLKPIFFVENEVLIKLGMLDAKSADVTIDSSGFFNHANFLYIYEDLNGKKFKKGGEVNPSAEVAWKHKEGEPLTGEQFDSLPLVFMLYGIISGEPVWIIFERTTYDGAMEVSVACQNYEAIKSRINEVHITIGGPAIFKEVNNFITNFGLRINYGLNYVFHPAHSVSDFPFLSPIYIFSEEDKSDKYGIENKPYVRFSIGLLTENVPRKTMVYPEKISNALYLLTSYKVKNESLIKLGMLDEGAADATINKEGFFKHAPFLYVYHDWWGNKYKDGGAINKPAHRIKKPNVKNITEDELKELGGVFCLYAEKNNVGLWATVICSETVIVLSFASENLKHFENIKRCKTAANFNKDQQVVLINNLLQTYNFSLVDGLIYVEGGPGHFWGSETPIIIPGYLFYKGESQNHGLEQDVLMIRYNRVVEKNYSGQTFTTIFTAPDNSVWTPDAKSIYVDNKVLIALGMLDTSASDAALNTKFCSYVPFKYLYQDLNGNTYEDGGEIKPITIESLPLCGILYGKVRGQEVWVEYYKDKDASNVYAKLSTEDYSFTKHLNFFEGKELVEAVLKLGFTLNVGLNYNFERAFGESELPDNYLTPVFYTNKLTPEAKTELSQIIGFRPEMAEEGIVIIISNVFMEPVKGRTIVSVYLGESAPKFAVMSNAYLISIGLLLPGCENIRIDASNIHLYLNFRFVYENMLGIKLRQGGAIDATPITINTPLFLSPKFESGGELKTIADLPTLFVLYGQVNGERVWIQGRKPSDINIACSDHSKLVSNYGKPSDSPYYYLRPLNEVVLTALNNGFKRIYGLFYAQQKNGVTAKLPEKYLAPCYIMQEPTDELLKNLTPQDTNTTIKYKRNFIIRLSQVFKKNIPGKTEVWMPRAGIYNLTGMLPNEYLIKLGILLPGCESLRIDQSNIHLYLAFLYIYTDENGINYKKGGEVAIPQRSIYWYGMRTKEEIENDREYTRPSKSSEYDSYLAWLFDLQDAVTPEYKNRKDYSTKNLANGKSVLVRIKDHYPNPSNFIEEIEDDVAAVVNVIVPQNLTGKDRYTQEDLDRFKQNYPQFDIKTIEVANGDKISDVVDKIRQSLQEIEITNNKLSGDLFTND